MRRTISVIRCDRCGKRIYEGKYHIIETKYNLGNHVYSYEVCDDCIKTFFKALEYKNKMQSIWDNISEERLIEE